MRRIQALGHSCPTYKRLNTQLHLSSDLTWAANEMENNFGPLSASSHTIFSLFIKPCLAPFCNFCNSRNHKAKDTFV